MNLLLIEPQVVQRIGLAPWKFSARPLAQFARNSDLRVQLLELFPCERGFVGIRVLFDVKPCHVMNRVIFSEKNGGVMIDGIGSSFPFLRPDADNDISVLRLTPKF
jgi:hypothetical protein